MKRFHVHISVDSIDASVKFYNTLFGQQASVQHSDYAKWMLEDPRINFAISQRGAKAGLDHLGLQLESAEELHGMTAQLQSAGLAVTDLGEATCCYAQSDKGWVHDPQGIAWESFVTLGQATTYGSEPSSAAGPATGAAATSVSGVSSASSACCAPAAKRQVALSDIAVMPAVSCGPAAAGTSGCC